MNHISKLCGFVLPLLLSVNMASAQEWRRVTFVDFKGNSAADPDYRSAALSNSDEGETDLQFSAGPTKGNKYMIAKHPGASRPDNWVTGGDHTHLDDKNIGYYLMIDCPASARGGNTSGGEDSEELDYPNQVIFRKTLSNVCPGVKYKFEAFIANMSKDDKQNLLSGSKISLGIFNSSGAKLWERDPPVMAPNSDPNAEALNWQEVSGVFEDVSSNGGSLVFKVYPVNGSNPGAVTNGFDFGIDDIAIYVQQPTLQLSASEMLYEQPGKLTGSVDAGSFFADLSNVSYKWEYSQDSVSWSALGSPTAYSNGTDYAYNITKFDKDNTNGQGNGYYRLTIATNDVISSVNDETVCCIRQVCRINEKLNHVKLVLCENESKVLGGTTFGRNLADGEHLSADGNFKVDLKVIKNEVLPIINYTGCPGIPVKLGNGQVGPTYEKTGVYLDDTPVYTYSDDISTESNEKCITSTQQYKYSITEGQTTNKPIDLCQGEYFEKTELTYNEVGPQDAKDIQIDCNTERYYVTVHPTYNDLTVEETICSIDKYNGVSYSVGDHTLPTQHLETPWHCDSVVTVKLHVLETAKGTLPDTVICQGAVGKGKTAFSYGGVDYKNETATDYVFKAVETYPGSSASGCDSITEINVTIHPFEQIVRDTTICRDQILFGQEWKVASPEGEPFRKDMPMSVEQSRYGCPGGVVTWNVKVLQIQLKLRVGAEESIDPRRTIVCDGTSATIRASLVGEGLYPLEWEPSLPPSNNNKFVVTPDESTVYIASASNTYGCHATDTVKVDVMPSPTMVIDSVDQQERTLTFSVEGGTPEYKYFIGTANANLRDEHTVEKLIYGKHEFRIVDANSCAAADSFLLEPTPIEPSMYMSPNGDGIYDTWKIKGIDAYPEAFVRIYNRYGKLVYERRGYENETGFDGTYNGNRLPSTDYWYVIDLESVDKQFVGHFTILR